MKRWWLMVALLLSLGFNLGLLAAVAGGWWASRGGETAVVEEAAEREREVRPEDTMEGTREDTPEDTASAQDPERDGLSPGSRELGWEGETGVELPEEPRGAPATTEDSAADEGGGEGGDEGGEDPGDQRGGEAAAGGTGAGRETGAVAGPPFDRGPGDPGPDGPGPGGPGPGGPGGRDFDPSEGPPLGRMADHLGLEGEVRERFLELQRRFVRNRFEIHRRGRVLTLEMHRELASRRPDPERVEALIDHRAELWRQQEVLTARTILETRSILEPEQQRRYLQVLRHLVGGPGGGPGEGRSGMRPGARLRGEGRGRPGLRPGPPAGPPFGEDPPADDSPGAPGEGP